MLLANLTRRREVHLWQRGLDLRSEPPDRQTAWLNPDEKQRADNFRREADRRRFILRHGHLREILALYLNTRPDHVNLDARLHQPPGLAAGDLAADLRFSLSGSRDQSVVALAWRRRVGVDIEAIDKDIDVDAVANNTFSRQECQALHAAPAIRRRAIFFQIWTRKEAFLKALEIGLMRNLKSFCVLGPDPKTMAESETMVADREAGPDDARWLVRDVHGPSAFALACCAEGNDWSIVRHEDGA